MRASRGEIKIEDILTAADVDFREEVSFPGLNSVKGNPLRFDFAVYDDCGDLDFLIEYQGIQHYIPKDKFGGMPALKLQQYHDMLKREYCREHNIPLVCIPYTDENIISYDYIFKAAGY